MADCKVDFLVSCPVLFHHNDANVLHVSGIFHFKKSSCDRHIDLPNISIMDKGEVQFEEAYLKLHHLFSSRTENKTDVF